MNTTRRLWVGLGLLLAVAFAVLLAMGWELYLKAPPMPERVVAANGQQLYSRADIELGRRVWQSIGGQQLGSILGAWSAGGAGLERRLAAPRGVGAA